MNNVLGPQIDAFIRQDGDKKYHEGNVVELYPYAAGNGTLMIGVKVDGVDRTMQVSYRGTPGATEFVHGPDFLRSKVEEAIAVANPAIASWNPFDGTH